MNEPRRGQTAVKRSLHRILGVVHVIAIAVACFVIGVVCLTFSRSASPGAYLDVARLGLCGMTLFVSSAIALLSGLGLMTVQCRVREGAALTEGFALAISIVAAILFLLFSLFLVIH